MESAASLAERINGIVIGDADKCVSGVATLEDAGPGDLSWLGAISPELLERVAASDAGVVLVPADCDAIENKTLIKVADPDLALCDLLTALAPPVNCVPAGVHPTATVALEAMIDGAAIGANVFVGAGAVVGPGTQLHPGVYVGPATTIGRDCVVWPNAVVRERVTIGDRVIIHPGATLGADGYGYLQRGGKHVKIPQIGTVVIEDDVEIGAGTAIDRARSGVTRIGRGTKIDNLTQIGHNVTVGEHCIIIAQCAIAGSVTIGNYVVMGGQSGIADHRTVGDGAQIAAKSTAMGNVPPGQVVRGNPAVPHSQFLRQEATVRKLPKWIDHLRDLTARVERLEGTPSESPENPTA